MTNLVLKIEDLEERIAPNLILDLGNGTHNDGATLGNGNFDISPFDFPSIVNTGDNPNGVAIGPWNSTDVALPIATSHSAGHSPILSGLNPA